MWLQVFQQPCQRSITNSVATIDPLESWVRDLLAFYSPEFREYTDVATESSMTAAGRRRRTDIEYMDKKTGRVTIVEVKRLSNNNEAMCQLIEYRRVYHQLEGGEPPDGRLAFFVTEEEWMGGENPVVHASIQEVYDVHANVRWKGLPAPQVDFYVLSGHVDKQDLSIRRVRKPGQADLDETASMC
jgi:hypothetical protein